MPRKGSSFSPPSGARSPISVPESREDARLGLRTATGVTPNRTATSAGVESYRQRVSQNIRQVRSSNAPRTRLEAPNHSLRAGDGGWVGSSESSTWGSATPEAEKASLPPPALGKRPLRRWWRERALRAITSSQPLNALAGAVAAEAGNPAGRGPGRPPAPRHHCRPAANRPGRTKYRIIEEV